MSEVETLRKALDFIREHHQQMTPKTLKEFIDNLLGQEFKS